MTAELEGADLARSLSNTLLLLILVVGVAYPTAVWRLKTYHRETWRRLGRPSAFGWPFARSARRLLVFATSFRHLRLNDLTLSLACVGFTLGVVALVAASFAVLWWWFSSG